MANTFNVSKINTLHANSQASTTGELTIDEEDIESGPSESDVEIADSVTDPNGATIYTVSRFTMSIALADYDFLFTDTMDDGNTLLATMTSRSTAYLQFDLEGGTLQDSTANTWFEVRPVVSPDMDNFTDDDLISGMLEFTYSDHGGVPVV